MSLTFLLINFGGIEHPIADDFQAVGRNLAEKTALIAFMASRAADLLDAKQDGVAVAIEMNTVDELHVSAFLALPPQFFTASAVINSAAGGERFGVAFGVHVREHEDIAGGDVLRDGRQKPSVGRERGGGSVGF